MNTQDDRMSQFMDSVKLDQMNDIKQMLAPLNKIFSIATSSQIEIKLDTENQMVQFVSAKNSNKLHEISYKNKSPLGLIKSVMEEV